MKVLVIGGGGREHALAWRLSTCPSVSAVYCAPGNAGTALEAGVTNVDLPASPAAPLLEFALAEKVDLTIIGPEAPLAAGLADRFAERGLVCLGPGAAGARLEASKEFAKAFMERHAIPTAGYRVFTQPADAHAWLDHVGAPVVVKADGLAAGKGVVVASSLAEAKAAVDAMFSGRFGQAGERVVIEEFLAGEEASFIVLTDGESILPLASSQDHKARDEGDHGPNTGGMGAYSPASIIDEGLHERVLREVMTPAVRGLARDGVAYRGFLYAGLMISPGGEPRVLEFNCRLGDPETQPILMRLRSDLAALCLAAAEGRLADMRAQWDARAALGVVLASRGYPERYPVDEAITGLPSPGEAAGCPDARVFHAGTRLDGERVLTSGGRVLCVMGMGSDVAEAAREAYALADRIDWPSKFLRRDIGYRALRR